MAMMLEWRGDNDPGEAALVWRPVAVFTT